MILKAEDPKWGQVEYDIIVVGAGAAGVAVASSAAAEGASVVVLESGGASPSVDLDLSSAEVFAREPLHDMAHARPRGVGGSTQIWGGWCTPLDPEDMNLGSPLHGANWPIDYQTVASYLPAARVFCGIPESFKAPTWALKATIKTAFPDFDTMEYPVLGKRNLGLAHIELFHSDRVDLVTEATALSIVMTANGRRAETVRIRAGAGLREIKAQTIVVATGAVEAARLLLVSADHVWPNGIGNHNGHVGCYFMDHPQVEVVRFRADHEELDIDYFLEKSVANTDQGTRLGTVGALVSSPSRLQRGSTGRFRLAIEPAGEHFRHGLPRTRNGAIHLSSTRRTEADELAIVASIEQIPDCENRVRLSKRLDRFGVPKPRVDWRLTDVDHATIQAAAEAAQAIARTLGGTAVRLSEANEGCWDTVGGPHHLGTTRMSTYERDGVVTKHGRVHGTDNVFVTGGSIFPTGGHAPPTLTLIALALRLGNHIGTRAR